MNDDEFVAILAGIDRAKTKYFSLPREHPDRQKLFDIVRRLEKIKDKEITRRINERAKTQIKNTKK